MPWRRFTPLSINPRISWHLLPDHCLESAFSKSMFWLCLLHLSSTLKQVKIFFFPSGMRNERKRSCVGYRAASCLMLSKMVKWIKFKVIPSPMPDARHVFQHFCCFLMERSKVWCILTEYSSWLRLSQRKSTGTDGSCCNLSSVRYWWLLHLECCM